MAYDEELANRVRSALSGQPVQEKRMFGGLAFLVGGNMSVAVSGQGGLMVRAAPGDTEALLAEPGASPMVMSGRAAKGWVRVAAAALDDEQTLAAWVRRGVDHARSLPEKPPLARPAKRAVKPPRT